MRSFSILQIAQICGGQKCYEFFCTVTNYIGTLIHDEQTFREHVRPKLNLKINTHQHRSLSQGLSASVQVRISLFPPKRLSFSTPQESYPADVSHLVDHQLAGFRHTVVKEQLHSQLVRVIPCSSRFTTTPYR